jgi:putative membrane protein
VGVIIILSILWGVFSDWDYGDWWRMMGPGMMGGFGFMWFMPILWIAAIGLIIWAVVAAVRGVESTGQGSPKSNSALEILKQRYARGEITKEEYEQKKRDIA